MPSRQVMEPPFGIGVHYKIFNADNPAAPGVLTVYSGMDHPIVPMYHQFDPVSGGAPLYINTNAPQYGTSGLFVGYKGNAGGRRKSRRSKHSKRSKQSHRKTKRRY